MKVIYILSVMTKEEEDEQEKFYGGTNVPEPMFNCSVEIEGSTQKVRKITELLRTKYELR